MANRIYTKLQDIRKRVFQRFSLALLYSLLLITLTGGILIWFVNFENSNFIQNQQDLATASVKGTEHNLSQLISLRRQEVIALVQQEPQLLLDLVKSPTEKDQLDKLKTLVKNRLPEYFTFQLTDSSGIPLLPQRQIKIGTKCKKGLHYFANFPEKFSKTIILHGSGPEDFHFDIMVDIEPSKHSPIFFVSFNIKDIIELLTNSEIPGQSLLVVKKNDPSKIEMSADGVYRSNLHSKFLSANALNNILYQKPVKGTGWSIQALANEQLIRAYRDKLILGSSFLFFILTIICISYLWRLWIEENSRIIAESKLRKMNEELEEKVKIRTRALAVNENNLQETFMSAPYGMFVVDDRGVIELINKRAAEIFSYGENELLNRSMNILLPEKMHRLHDAKRAEFFKDRQSRQMGKGRHLTAVRKNGKEIPVEIGLSPLEHSGGKKTIVSISDISDLVIAQQKLKEEHERAIVTLNSIADGVITTDIDGEINSINPVAERLCGWQEADAVGRHISQVFMLANEKTGKKVNDPVLECLNKKAIVEPEKDVILINRLGLEIPIEDSAAPILDEQGLAIGAVVVFHDVSQTRARTHEIEYQANHDSLTGLLNRREFDRRVAQAINKTISSTRENCLLFMDLDRFKQVNDSAGHAAGDELLIQLTHLLSGKLRRRDTFARLGGDEFAIILEHCNIDLGLKIADKLRKTVADFRLTWEGNTYDIGVSIGVVPFTSHLKSADDLLKQADAACYQAKESGRNRVQLYEQNISR